MKRALRRVLLAEAFRAHGDLYSSGHDQREHAQLLAEYRRHGIPMGPRLDRAPRVLADDDVGPWFPHFITRTKDGSD